MVQIFVLRGLGSAEGLVRCVRLVHATVAGAGGRGRTACSRGVAAAQEALDASPAQEEAAIALSEEWGRRRDGCTIDLTEMPA